MALPAALSDHGARAHFFFVVLAGGVANAVALYAVSAEDSYLRVSTNLVSSPLALALFAVLGAAVALGVGRRGWIAAPVAFYVGLVLLAFTPTLTDGTPLILNGYRLARIAVIFAPIALVALLAAVAVGRLRRRW
jgi:uncharacterized membrane protein YjjP (DUF1212 family)